MMGGTVKVFSVVGEGSAFVIHLPLKVPRHQHHATDGIMPSFDPLGTELEDCSNRNWSTPCIGPESGLFEAPATATDLNGNSSLPLATAATATLSPPLFGTASLDNNAETAPPQPLFGLSNGAETAPPQPLFGSSGLQEPNTDLSAPLFGNNTGAQPTNSASSAPLFGANNVTQPPTAVQPAPLFGTNGLSVGTNSSQAGTMPQPPMSAPPPRKVRQLPKFHFEKNNNLVLVVDDNAVGFCVATTTNVFMHAHALKMKNPTHTAPLLLLCVPFGYLFVQVNRKLLSRMLTYFNIEFQTAENGQIAVDIMKESRNATGDPSAPHFGMVLMDLSMPVMDGYEAILTLRKKMLLDVPIVALTANAMEEEKRKSLENGASEFATKPILRPTLHAKCVLYLSPTLDELSESPP